jgi:hypothetical protein
MKADNVLIKLTFNCNESTELKNRLLEKKIDKYLRHHCFTNNIQNNKIESKLDEYVVLTDIYDLHYNYYFICEQNDKFQNAIKWKKQLKTIFTNHKIVFHITMKNITLYHNQETHQKEI